MALGSNNFSIWCDFLERDFLKSGFPDLLDSGIVSGVTSNPVIFKNAIVNSEAYTEDKRKITNLLPIEQYELLAIEDIKNAAKQLLPIHEIDDHDGFASIEVNPLFANDAKKMSEEAKRLHRAIGMPNVMIKIPATPEGFETIKDLIIEGINVNATLVFSPLQAGKCLQAIENGFYIFQRRNPKKKFPQAVISVFVSRFDRKLDASLQEHGMEKMTFGAMNASYIYQLIREQKISNVRCLFASTGVSDKSINGSYYINKLLYNNAINTAPLNAIESFIENLDMPAQVCPDKESIQKYFDEVEAKGIVLKDVYNSLLKEGLEQFNTAFREMLLSFKTDRNDTQMSDDTQKEKVVSNKKTSKESKKEEIKTRVEIKPNKQSAQNAKKAEKMNDDISAVRFLRSCLQNLVSYKGSDLHIKADADIKGRVNGEIVTVDGNVFTKNDMEILAEELLGSRYDEFTKKKNIDFIYKLDEEYRFRVNMFYQTDGISAAFRVVPLKLPTVELMELPSVIEEFASKRRGLVLVTGPTGCGKSTTLATIINMINQTSQRHIITIEDPIEFIYKDEQSIVNQRSVGQDAISFADALTASLREDPDVIMVGEMRDIETIRTAIRAAETGHLVFSTLHTLDAKETIGRIIGMFEGSEQSQIRQSLSSVLEAVVSQRLVRRKGGKGRVAAVEVLIKSARMQVLIAQGREAEIKDAIEADRDVYHSQSFNQSLLELYIADTISYHEALYTATSPADLKILLDNYDIKKNKEAKDKDIKIYVSDEENSENNNVMIDMNDLDILALKR
ncbi:MAG: transaldolase [Campylobacteraceae bacterium]|jgi:twitching motility protein PilT|nr:transaldolase [Campylobacteraceae bacterium]